MADFSQSKLIEISSSPIENNDFFKIYYKSVSIKEIQSKEDFTSKNKKEIIDVINALPSSNELEFGKLVMETNKKIWINSLLSEINMSSIVFLLNDFTDHMYTNMREKDKYAILIVQQNELILVHTKMGEKSLSPNFKFFDRMLDKDNIMRYVCFKQTNECIKVKYYEKYQSKFFTKWLGINRKDLFYEFGGMNKFYLDLYGYPLVLEINDEDFDNNDFFDFEKNILKLKNPPEELKINHIKRLNKRYQDISEFKKDHTSRRFNLKYHQEKYVELMNSLIPLENKIYDYETEVKSPDGKYSFQKKNTNLTILFCNDKIEIDEGFLDSIIVSIINNGELELCHAGLKIDNPIVIGNLNIYNNLNLNLTKPLIDYYNSTELSSSHKKEFLCVIFHCLSVDNKDNVYNYFLTKCSVEFSKKLSFLSDIYENDIIELKSRDFLPKKDKEIVDNLSEDINKKLYSSSFKFYIIGYDEKTKKYEPLSENRFNDSRLENLTKNLKEKTKLTSLTFLRMSLGNGECILSLIVKND